MKQIVCRKHFQSFRRTSNHSNRDSMLGNSSLHREQPKRGENGNKRTKRNERMRNKTADWCSPVVSAGSFCGPREKCASRGTKSPAMERKSSRRSQRSDSRCPATPGTRWPPPAYPTPDPSSRASGQLRRGTIKSRGLQSWFLFFLRCADGHNRYRWRPRIYIRGWKRGRWALLL